MEARLHDARKRVAELQAQSPEGKSRPDTKRTNALLGFFGYDGNSSEGAKDKRYVDV